MKRASFRRKPESSLIDRSVLDTGLRRYDVPAVRAFTVILFVLTVTSCASAPEVDAPDLPFDVPAAWAGDKGANAGTPRDQWWRDFNDELLNKYVDEAFANNPGLEVAAARIDAASALARIAGAGELPELIGGFRAQRQQQIFTGIPTPSGAPLKSRADTFGLSLDLSWELDLWGRVRSEHAAALADVEASVADYHGARLLLAAHVVKAYVLVYDAQTQLQIAEESLASAQSVVSTVERRFNAGTRGAIDVSFAKSDEATLRAAIEQRKQALDASRRALEVFLGRYPAGAIEVTEDLIMLPQSPPVGLPAGVVARRPD
ncbi:MAG: TolC family protein, partial [Planctomycetes bacterium]|nr:TolC family protein [Planctomycetota bacterium]